MGVTQVEYLHHGIGRYYISGLPPPGSWLIAHHVWGDKELQWAASGWIQQALPSSRLQQRGLLCPWNSLSGEADFWDLGISGARIRDGSGMKMGGEGRIFRWKSSSWASNELSSWGLKEGS